MADITIRAARPEDFKTLCDIQEDSVEVFRSWMLGFIADEYPRSEEFYEEFFSSGPIFIALDETGRGVGYALLREVDGQGHLKQLSVREDSRCRGFGTALIRAAISRAEKHGYKTITLTTWRDIPFNAPFYRKLGFSAFDPDKKEWPELIEIRRKEREKGYDVQPRLCMRLDLSRNQ